jgi:hypothetical protein
VVSATLQLLVAPPGVQRQGRQTGSDALASPDAATARPLFVQAEHALGDENVFLPLGAPIRWSLIAGDLRICTEPLGFPSFADGPAIALNPGIFTKFTLSYRRKPTDLALL